MGDTVSEHHFRPLIADRRPAVDGPERPLIDPATEEAFGVASDCGRAEVDEAVVAATAAQRTWAAMDPTERGRLLGAWADRIELEGPALGLLDTRTVGRPVRDTRQDAAGVAGMVRYWAGMVDKLRGTQLPVAQGHLVYTRREPLGVVGILLPWNGPASGFAERVAPALACGNAVVAKPSELSPLSAIRLAELALEVGLPPGLVNVVTGAAETGAMVAAHPGITGISFTGSRDAGRSVGVAAAAGFKQVVLELGGKSPNIIFADADLDRAIRGSLWGVFFNTGQVCCAGTRLLVERGVADEVVERLAAAAAQLQVGDPNDPATHMGPLASRQQLERVGGFLAAGAAAGLRVAGAPRALPERGYYVPPTIYCDVDPGSDLAQQEVFGPVLSVIPFDSDADALTIANAVPYGLAATIWTRDISRMLSLAERLDVGSVWGNTKQLFHPAMPFGGFKDSGVGNAGGDCAIEANTRVKVVAVRHDEGARDPGWDDLA
jgi:acyl-CoA reductase-like NAD-dependent aldehyde dehydrogenase